MSKIKHLFFSSFDMMAFVWITNNTHLHVLVLGESQISPTNIFTIDQEYLIAHQSQKGIHCV